MVFELFVGEEYFVLVDGNVGVVVMKKVDEYFDVEIVEFGGIEVDVVIVLVGVIVDECDDVDVVWCDFFEGF